MKRVAIVAVAGLLFLIYLWIDSFLFDTSFSIVRNVSRPGDAFGNYAGRVYLAMDFPSSGTTPMNEVHFDLNRNKILLGKVKMPQIALGQQIYTRDERFYFMISHAVLGFLYISIFSCYFVLSYSRLRVVNG